MPGIPAAARHEVVVVRRRVAADARQMSVTQPNVLVHRRLGFTKVIRPALQLLLTNLDFPAFNLRQFYAFFLLLGPGDYYSAVRRTPGLEAHSWDE